MSKSYDIDPIETLTDEERAALGTIILDWMDAFLADDRSDLVLGNLTNLTDERAKKVAREILRKVQGKCSHEQSPSQ